MSFINVKKQNSLVIKAGPGALKHISKEGLQAKDISTILGGAGGPKALSLIGLDQAVFSEFLPLSNQKRWLIGSSIGNWRFLCAAKNNPKAAFDHFAKYYVEKEVNLRGGTKEVTRITKELLLEILGDDRDQILNNPHYHLAIITTRCHGLLRNTQYKKLLLSGLGIACLLNGFNRSMLRYCVERVIFHDKREIPPINFSKELPTTLVSLDKSNFFQALMASTAIPAAIDPVIDPIGAPNGVYRDGGIIDYHLDLPISNLGMTLCVHHYPRIITGWFDKFLPWRKASAENSDKLIIVSPSTEYVKQLPFGKIPCRKDYLNLTNTERKKNWRIAISESKRLGDEFLELVEKEQLISQIKAI
jgi:hypothetical protein